MWLHAKWASNVHGTNSDELFPQRGASVTDAVPSTVGLFVRDETGNSIPGILYSDGNRRLAFFVPA